MTHYTYVLRSADGAIHVEQDLSEEGLFPRAAWRGLPEEAGFNARSVPVEHSEVEKGTYEAFVCTRR